MEGDTAHELHIKGNHVPDNGLSADFKLLTAQTAAGIFDDGECFAHDIIKRLPFGKTVAELLCFGFQFVISKCLQVLFQFVDTGDQRQHFFDITLRLGSEYGFENSGQHCEKIPLFLCV